MTKILTVIEAMCLVFWCLWVAMGGNNGDMERTVNGTLIFAFFALAAFCMKLAWRWKYGDC